MNKKGQTLTLFIILIPLILILMALVVDVSYVVNRRVAAMELTREIFKSNNLDEDKVKEVYKKNNIDVDNLVVTNKEIAFSFKVKSIFGNIIGIKEYEIKLEETKNN